MTVAAPPTKRFLVTGATGYLGPWLAREIIQNFGKGSLTCLIPKSLPPLEQKSLAYLRQIGAQCLECNLMTNPVLEGSLPPVDVLIHMAANTRTDLPERDLLVNTMGTANLIDTFGHLLNGKRVLLTSTSAAIDRDSRPTNPLTEESPARPRTGYGRTKLQAEAIVLQKSRDFNFAYTILRLTTLYGPGMRGGLFYVLANWTNRGQFLARINWPGRASFTFVEDASKILLWFASAEAGHNQIYFVSSGETCTIDEVADLISKKLGGRRSRFSMPKWFWSALQRAIWLPGVKQIVPWRLANVMDDSLLCDSSRMRRIYPGALTLLDAGLDRTFGPVGLEDELARSIA
jgi:nucleoside-diphosphate-sugar epimerase